MTAVLSGGITSAVAGFTEAFDWAIFQSDGVMALAIADLDVVHFELYDVAGGTLIVQCDDANPTAGGSSVSISSRGNVGTNTPASGQVILDEDDSAGLAGRKHFVMWFEDTADNGRKKVFHRGTLNFLAG